MVQHDHHSKESHPRKDVYFDEKKHYESLISYFKSVVGITGTFLTIIALAAGFISYNSGKEMRDELKEAKKDAMDQVKEMKEEVSEQKENLSRQTTEMNLRLNGFLQSSQSQIDITQQRAETEISSIRDLATNEARNRIDQVFKDNNIEDFVADVARQRIEPKVKGMVDEKFKAIEDAENLKITTAIADLSSSSSQKVSNAISLLMLNSDRSFRDEEVLALIAQARNPNIPQDVKSNIILILSKQVATPVTEYFKELTVGITLEGYGGTVLSYLTTNYPNQDFYVQIAGQPSKTDMYRAVVGTSAYNNKALAISLLNNRRLVDDKRMKMQGEWKDYQAEFHRILLNWMKEEEIANTYFMKTK